MSPRQPLKSVGSNRVMVRSKPLTRSLKKKASPEGEADRDKILGGSIMAAYRVLVASSLWNPSALQRL
jgi:hypothetical protein